MLRSPTYRQLPDCAAPNFHGYEKQNVKNRKEKEDEERRNGLDFNFFCFCFRGVSDGVFVIGRDIK